jgi:hypothetical protein
MVAERGYSRFVIKGSFLQSAKGRRGRPKSVSHVYYMKWLDRAGAVLAMAAGAVLCTIALSDWSDPIIPSHNRNLIGFLASAALLLYGIYKTANAFISTVTLFPGSVEVRTAFSRESLPSSKIRGRREYVNNWGRSKTWYYSLVPNDDKLGTLDFEQDFNFDETFFSWFNHLPDLDAADEEKNKESIAAKR